MKHMKMPDKLECYHAFGSLVIAVPDSSGRVGCHGPCVAWLNPNEDTFGLHAEGAAITRHDDATEILNRWVSLTHVLRGVGGGRVRQEAAMEEIANLEQIIKTSGTPGNGFVDLFAAARSVFSNGVEPMKPPVIPTGTRKPGGGTNHPGAPEGEGQLGVFKSPYSHSSWLVDIAERDSQGELRWVALPFDDPRYEQAIVEARSQKVSGVNLSA